MSDLPRNGFELESTPPAYRDRASVVSRQGLRLLSFSLTRQLEAVLLLVVLLIAIGLCLWISGRLPLESDEAIVGLMGKHILELGKRPVFYYGQTYMGAVEAYLVALSFMAGGVSAFSMRLVTIVLSGVFCALTYVLGKRLYDSTVGLVSALYVGLSPIFLTVWSIKVRGGFVEILVLGTLLLILLHDIAYRSRQEVWRVALLGLVGGLAFWANQLVLPYLLAVALFFLLRLGRKCLPLAPIALLGFFLGSLPLWVWNIQNDFATFYQIVAMNSGGVRGLVDLVRSAVHLGVNSVPALLGLLEPIGSIGLFRESRHTQPLAFALGMLAGALLGVVALYWLVFGLRQGLRRFVEKPELPLATMAAITLFISLLSPSSFWYAGEPLYLLPIYSAVPFFAAFLVQLGRRSRLAAAVVLVIFLGINLWSNIWLSPYGTLPTVAGRPIPIDNSSLQSYLLANGDTRIFADYWFVFPLAFESDEQILGVAMGLDFKPGGNRYPPYVNIVEGSEHPAFVLLTGTDAERAFQSQLIAQGAQFRRVEVGEYSVYDRIDPPQYIREIQ